MANVRNYKVDDATVEEFQGLSTFAKNMVIKDSMLYENAETDLSRLFGNLLLKYYNTELSYTDVKTLYEFVTDYNNFIDEKLFSNEPDPEFLARAYGLWNTQNYESSILSILTESIISDNLKDFKNAFYDETKNISVIPSNLIVYRNVIRNLLYNTYFKNQFIEPFNEENLNFSPTQKTYISINGISFDNNKISIDDNIWDNIGDDIYRFISDNNDGEILFMKKGDVYYITKDPYTIKLELDDNGKLAAIIENGLSDFKIGEKTSQILYKDANTNPGHTTTNDEIDKLKNAFLKKEKILISKRELNLGNSQITEKLKASEAEKNFTNNGECVVFFDIRVEDKDNKIFKNTNTISKQRLIAEDDLSLLNETHQFYSLLIVYKEFNPEYRSILNSVNIETILNFEESRSSTDENKEIVNITTVFDNMMKYINKDLYTNTYLNSYVLKYVKNVLPSKYVARDFYSYDDNDSKIILTKTLRLFKYQYGNPYTARNASESEIMVYYYGDEYISYQSYGKYNYQKEEIYDFLKNFQFIHDYYYKVLLNESFTKESEYFLYEKLFITFWALEKTLSDKLENMHDIDHFDLIDITNFFESYGLSSLTNIIKDNYDVDLEMYSKNLIKSYIKLVQNKGSKSIIDIIQEAFTLDKKALKIYRLFLYRDTNSTDSDEKYKFIRIESTSTENILREVINNKSTSIGLEALLKKKDNEKYGPDKYWNIENTSPELLDKLNVSGVNSKYIIPEVTNEIAESYNMSRITFALIDFIYERIGHLMNVEEAFSKFIISSDDTIFNASVNIKEFIDGIRYLFSKYFELKGKSEISNEFQNQYSYRINKEELGKDKIGAYFDIKGPDADGNLDIIIKDRPLYSNYLNNNDDIQCQKEYLELLKEFYLFYYLTEDATNKTEASTISNKLKLKVNNEEYSFSSIDILIDKMLGFPKKYFSESRWEYTTEDAKLKTAISHNTKKFVNDLFTNIFHEEKNNTLYFDNSDIIRLLKSDYTNNMDELTCKTAINNSLSILNDALNTAIEFNLYSNIKTIISFLRQIIEYFISYTTQLFDFTYNNIYNTHAEALDITDDLELNLIEMQDSDSFFYDENLSIELKEKGEI